MLEVTVRCRIDDRTKEKVGLVLDRMGMTLSTAIRLFLKRIAEDEAFPFDINKSTQHELTGIKAALAHLMQEKKISGQGIEALLQDPILEQYHSLSQSSAGLPSLGAVKRRKQRNKSN